MYKFTIKSMFGLGMIFLPFFTIAFDDISDGINGDSYNPPFLDTTIIDEDSSKYDSQTVVSTMTTGNDSMINQLLNIFGFNTTDTGAYSGHLRFMTYVKSILNVTLGLLSLVTLVILIYTFYMMFFSENEAGIKKAKGTLVGLFLALAIIGLAWLIVSFIFRWYKSNWLENVDSFSESTTL